MRDEEDANDITPVTIGTMKSVNDSEEVTIFLKFRLCRPCLYAWFYNL